jgi:hypothetical protein
MTKRTPASGRLDLALEALQKYIADGCEYPDAEWKAASVYAVDCDELRDAYDIAQTKEKP